MQRTGMEGRDTPASAEVVAQNEVASFSTGQELRPQQYWLAPHLYVCPTHDGVVLLDLRHDNYLGLGIVETCALAQIVPGWPVHPDAAMGSLMPSVTQSIDVAERCVAEGVLVREASKGKPATPVLLTNAPTLTELGRDEEHRRPITMSDVLNFACAWTSAAYALRFSEIERTVKSVEERRRHHSRAQAHFDSQRAAELTSVFHRIKPYVFTAENRCLLHALALVNFLACYEVFPMWVMGVKLRPFTAHSWVQYDRFTLDSTPEEVCSYTPILAV